MEDDWCLLSDDEEFVTVAPSRDASESEPEQELEPIETKSLTTETVAETPVPALNTFDGEDDRGISLDDIDISTLLQDSPALRSPSARAFSYSLLALEHRSCRAIDSPRVGRCVEVHSSGAAAVRKRAVRLAFSEPRTKSFPERLRAAVPSRRETPDAVVPPAFTPLTAITCDQGMQVDTRDLIEPNCEPEPRAARLQSALERCMRTAEALKSKSQDHERLALKLLNTEALLERSEHCHERDMFKLQRLEGGLELAKRREQLHAQEQAALTSELERLRAENAELQRIGAFMTDDSANMASQSVDVAETMSIEELERLELMLARNMDSVRAAMRAKYKHAIARAADETRCVVCLSERATVLLLPCRHEVVCSTCALRVATCPIDREVIQDKVLTFGLDAYA